MSRVFLTFDWFDQHLVLTGSKEHAFILELNRGFIRTYCNFQAALVLIKMGLYWPNFSLVFLIHLFLYTGVYCIF